MEVQLDPVGGIAGDMFIAALLHAFPEHQDGLFAAVDAMRLPGLRACRVEAHRNHGLHGLRFLVEVDGAQAGDGDAEDHHTGEHQHASVPWPAPDAAPVRHGHGHVTWREIKGLIGDALLPAGVKSHALGIFGLLAQAEAQVHGIAEEHVAFHEVGATDSIVDIVGAAQLIAVLDAGLWSIGSLPLGTGRIRTAHGLLPVPAPATAWLLEGFPVHQDGIDGERVTPTGAAIVRYLGCRPLGRRISQALLRSGTGLGTKSLAGISNCLRVLAFSEAPARREEDDRAASQMDTAAAAEDWRPGHPAEGTVADGFPAPDFCRRELAVVEFEVDDQTPEDLAAALDRLRSHPAILDVVQQTAIGKRGRSAAHLRLLTAPDDVEEVARRCFEETTTIGLRYHFVHGFTLARTIEPVAVTGRPVRVKVVSRPGAGFSGKAEIEDLARIEGGHFRRIEAGQLATEQAFRQLRDRQPWFKAEHENQKVPPTELPGHDESA
ncbi:MAG: LarC family nickel insertion protein [Verrucomicrobia bacterium]|nr:LarC family nickel insertion protein [Verrucomicrobiota bacterium]